MVHYIFSPDLQESSLLASPFSACIIGKMESVEMSFQLQKDDVKKAFSIVRRETHFWVIVGVAVVMGIIWGGFHSGYNAIAALMTIGIFILIMRASTKPQISNESLVWHSPYTVSLSSKGVKTTSIHGESEKTWKGYTKVVETDEHFVLIRRSMVFTVLPKRGFGDKKLEAAREIFRGAMGQNFQTNTQRLSIGSQFPTKPRF